MWTGVDGGRRGGAVDLGRGGGGVGSAMGGSSSGRRTIGQEDRNRRSRKCQPTRYWLYVGGVTPASRPDGYRPEDSRLRGHRRHRRGDPVDQRLHVLLMGAGTASPYAGAWACQAAS